MKEKERYKLLEEDFAYAIVDNEEHKTYQNDCFDFSNICDLLNQQDKEIRELHTAINMSIPNQIAMKAEIERLHTCVDDRIAELVKENQQLKQQLAEHNEFFNAFDCKDFNEFKDFISTFMLAPHEEQTLIRELKQQLHDLPKKIVGEIRKEIEFPLYVHPDFDEFECVFDIDKLLDTILKKYGGENE